MWFRSEGMVVYDKSTAATSINVPSPPHGTFKFSYFWLCEFKRHYKLTFRDPTHKAQIVPSISHYKHMGLANCNLFMVYQSPLLLILMC